MTLSVHYYNWPVAASFITTDAAFVNSQSFRSGSAVVSWPYTCSKFSLRLSSWQLWWNCKDCMSSTWVIKGWVLETLWNGGSIEIIDWSVCFDCWWKTQILTCMSMSGDLTCIDSLIKLQLINLQNWWEVGNVFINKTCLSWFDF